MKTNSRALILAVGFALALALPAQAQVKQALDSDRIKGTIERLESTELKSKSASVQEVYKVSLLRLYNQYVSALRQDIADLKVIKSTVGEEDASAPDSISAKLRGLQSELDATTEKIRTLTGEVQASAAIPESTPATTTSVANRSPERPSYTFTRSAAQTATPSDLLASNQSTQTYSNNNNASPEVSDSLPSAESQRRRLASLVQTDPLKITVPSDDTKLNGPANLEIKVDPAKAIKQLNVIVIGSRETIIDNQTKKVDNNEDVQKITVKLAKGVNTVKVIALNDKGDPIDAINPVSRTITCEGSECGKAATATSGSGTTPAATEAAMAPTDSLYTRAVIGFEQAGVSSSDSESRPFLDLFFSAPLSYKKRPRVDSKGMRVTNAQGRDIEDDDKRKPAISLWGNIRLASVPQQISAFRGLGTNFFGPISDNKVNDLVQGFDFMVGPEFRLGGTDVTHFGLIPGIRQRTSVNLIMGFGAISPLTTTNSAKIFNVPDPANPQYEAFIDEFPQAEGKKYIAYVAPERDRFLRQYYAGIRFKTFFLERKVIEGKKVDVDINRFPAIFDITFGQSDAVTGGKLHKFVLGFDGVYPLPFKGGRFVYLYGTAKLKAGGGKTIRTPFVLSNPGSDIQLTNNDLVITDRQTNRDYYRLGIGVNLAELFKQEPEKPKETKKEGDKKDETAN